MPSAYEAEAMRDRRRLGAAAHVELGEDARDVHARGLLGHEELRADLAVRGALRDQREHLPLAGGEAEAVLVLFRLGSLGVGVGGRGGRERDPRTGREAFELTAQPGGAEP